MSKHLYLVAAAILVAGSGVQAKSSHSDLKWGAAPPGLPAGAQMAVISGNPGAAGHFAVALKMPAGYSVPAHWHPTSEKLSIMSGKLAYGMSDKLDKDSAKWLSAGHHMTMPAKTNHWVYTTTAPAVLRISGKGPFAITYVDPKDDPRTK